MALGKESALSRHVTAGGLGSSEFGNSDNSLYASADHPIGRGGIMFSSCPSVCACVHWAEVFSDRLAVDF